MNELLTAAWTDALPEVLRLMSEAQQGMYRQEIQRYLATARFQPDAAEQAAPALQQLLLQSARAARVPPAISATREATADRATMVALGEHILAQWVPAQERLAESGTACARDGMQGEVFFGPRLGGTGRPGAVARSEEDPG